MRDMTFQYTDSMSKLSIFQGSLRIMSEEGDLFCSDLLTNEGRPAINSVMEGKTAARSSVKKMKNLKSNRVIQDMASHPL